MQKFDSLFAYLAEVDRDVLAYLRDSPANLKLDSGSFESRYLQEAVWSYVSRPAKRLRPAVMLLACGAVGGNPRSALPAAAGVEMFHTWTLVHDDIIDQDNLRRGAPTVHAAAREYGQSQLGLSEEVATEYGRNLAMLVGDAQTGWTTALFTECGLRSGVDPLVVLTILHHLQSRIVAQLVAGETMDYEFSLLHEQLAPGITESKIIDMLWLKTGVLYEFAGCSGAMIGKETKHLDDEQVDAIAQFAGRCGTAFQLQDDILGIVGQQNETGKPFGSDIREGKLTLVVYEARANASEAQWQQIEATLGNRHASFQEIEDVAHLLRDLGGIDQTAARARDYIESALPLLDPIPSSVSKSLLEDWAAFMIDRRF